MNNYCKHLKKRKNKPYCKLLDKEITLSECNRINSDNKCREYKTKNEIISSYKNINAQCNTKKRAKSTEKNTEMHCKSTKSNSSQIRNSAYSQHHSAETLHKMKNKSKKLAKLERDRFSIFTDDLTTCYLCGKPKNDLHELLEGRNRINSIKYGYVIPVCRLCHSQIQNNAEFKNVWAKKVQEHFEGNIGSRDDFLSVFRKNYLE